ncbi:MAG: outer-membrane lipoprotein carrier protein LolA [Pseudomonadota bacterium]
MSIMTRRQALALTAAALTVPATGASAQDRSVLVEVSKYLNQLTAIQGQFTQVNADGSRIGGQYYMLRPGRIRFEYDGNQSMVMADGSSVGVFDAKSTNIVQRYPLSQTPLRLLLRRDIDLAAQGVAVSTGSQDGFTSVVLRDPRRPRDGYMTLVLRNSPPSLNQWTVTDRSGRNTTVVLNTIERAPNMSRRLFNIAAEVNNWQLGRR